VDQCLRTPVILASWTLHTAGHEFFVSAGNPRATSKAIMDNLSIDQTNDARAELMLALIATM
jgi:hypothetical protein